MELVLSDEEIGAAFAEATEQSYLPQYANVFYDTTGRDKVIQYVDLDSAKVHNPTSTPKVEGDDAATPIEVPIYTVYKTITFEDRYEDDELVAQITAALPGTIAKAIDQFPLGMLDGLTTPIFTETSVIDGSLDSWVAADSDLADDGFEKNAWILDARSRSRIYSANKNSVSTLSNLAVPDGADLLGAPARFHTKFAPAGEYGYVLDGTGVFLVIQPSITIRTFGGQTGDYSLQLQNKVAAYVGIRMGVNLVPGAARRLVAAAS